MTIETEIGTEVLRELLAPPGPFLSVRFDLQARPEMGLDVEERRQGLRRDLVAAHGTTEGDLDALTQRFPGIPVGCSPGARITLPAARHRRPGTPSRKSAA